jgi:hypothetical protein
VGNNGTTPWECDPVSYYQASTGFAYHGKLACLALNCSQTQALVRRSEDGGMTWTDCEGRPGIQFSEDREWIVVDNTPTSPCYGTIYATWHNLNSEKVSRSQDNCATWSNPQSITAPFNAITPDLAVGANGTAFVVWSNYNNRTLRLARSTNCGQNWTPYGGTYLGPNNGANASGSVPAQCLRNAKNEARVDVDRSPDSPFFGRVYVAMFTYNQQCSTQSNWNCTTWQANWTNSCNFDVYLTYSDDDGLTWSAPVNLTEADGNNVDHFLGMLRVDPADGSVYLAYHMSRLNPVEAADRQTTHFYMTRSIDGGQTWQPPVQVSSLESNQREPGGNVFERGDYQGMAVNAGVAWPVWVDRRNAATEEEVIVRKVCSEPAHWTERSPTFSPPPIEIFGNETLTITWTAPDVYWGDGDESPDERKYQLWVDGSLAVDNIPWTATSTSYQPGDAANHSYTLRAVNQCGLTKDYGSVDHAACSANPDTVDVSPDGPITLCSGQSQLLTAYPAGGTADDFQWTRDGSPVGGNSSTYTAADSGTHTYNSAASNAACGDSVSDLVETQITWQIEPLFGGLQSVSEPASGACALLLEWAEATPVCAGPVVYNVYRSETPGFVPGAGNIVATALTGTSYVDTAGLMPGTTYYYVVRARDTSNAAEENNLVELSGAPSSEVFVLLEDDFEDGGPGWVFDLGTPPAIAGDFVIGDPVGTFGLYGSPSQPEDDHTPGGVNCMYTAEKPTASAHLNDIKNGEVRATSPMINADGYDRVAVSLWRWFFNEDNDDAGDYFVLEVSNDDGSSWTTLEEIPGSVTNANRWTHVSFNLEEFVDLTSTMLIRVRAADGPSPNDLVEAAIDDVEVIGYIVCVPVESYVFRDGFDAGGTDGWSGTSP